MKIKTNGHTPITAQEGNMKKTMLFVLAILATLIAAAPANAVNTVITKVIGNRTNISTTSSAALGVVGGKSTWYMREATVAENAPYTRFYLDYAAGFTGSVDYYCTYKDDGKR